MVNLRRASLSFARGGETGGLGQGLVEESQQAQAQTSQQQEAQQPPQQQAQQPPGQGQEQKQEEVGNQG